ncbi:MAG: bifunctional (p)ppGpp synthetase/guanosine-3',5'-bis(diphosphate) 3'-pyrophosphohydrolase [Desulfuromonadales bacterium]|nr:bifunctional (p)ppGpp synthetase/guanosine-3',5'-bis(diphosphate) 3'-pyrophosphohydrolase [Desulfuromonadales bacterium]HKJ28588.1 bifunctional (p)ppGpp synthetase/guanosine-3',5'-bis(diphosphate) 3'-pyrophosphohydrolase [Desulfuromonadales bacterium]
MIRIDDILEAIRSYHADADLDAVRKAYVYSAKVHQGQTRLSGDSYMTHLMEVASILTRLHMDVPTIMTGLLHDTIEDTLSTEAELREVFGDEVTEMVDGVTKISKITFKTSEERQAENFRKMLLAMARDIRVILVKLADRLHNMRTLSHQPEERRLKIAQETADIYAPLANRLGISWVKSELEDLSLRYLEPETYKTLSKKLSQHRRERDKYVATVKKKLEDILKEHDIDGQVQGRLKHICSIHKKIVKQKIEFEQIHDLIAFRIIVPTVRDCYAMLGVIHSSWKPVPGRFKDFIAMPKANMYQSLHTTVFGPSGQRMEVQMRTAEMHSVAEEGIAAHWKYKEGKSAAHADEGRFSWLRQMLEWQKELKDSSEFMSSVKVDLFPEEVYVFTPDGDVKELPKQSTPIDFAYSVHSDVGHRCNGAKVNGRLVPLRTELKNGDIVDIITSTNQTPSKDWLKFVKTSKAKNRIRHWVKDQERQKSLELGRDLLEKELRKFGFSYNRALNLDTVKGALSELGFRNFEDLQAAVGYGKVTCNQVLSRIIPEQFKAEAPKPSKISQVLGKIRRKPVDAINVQGLEGILVRFSKCCNPLPGDEVIGFISQGLGVTVHAADCPRVLETDPDRRVEVSWNRQKGATRSVKIRVYSLDQKGILATITKVITKNAANILRASVYSTNDGRGIHSFEIDVQDVQHLTRVMESVQKVKGVQQVERVRVGRNK